MSGEALFAVQAALHRHFARESHSEFGMILGAMLRSDRDRLRFFDGNLAIDHYLIQRQYVPGEIQRCAIEAAQRDSKLTPCFGYAVQPKCRPEESAWLLTTDGQVIDPARSRRPVDGWLGIALKLTEQANWTPDTPGAVAERDVHRQRVSAA